MQIQNEKHKRLGCMCIIDIISCKRSVQILLGDFEKIRMPSIRKMSNNFITLKIFILNHYGLTLGQWKGGMFLKWLCVYIKLFLNRQFSMEK